VVRLSRESRLCKRMYIPTGFENDSIRLYAVDISLFHENFNGSCAPVCAQHRGEFPITASVTEKRGDRFSVSERSRISLVKDTFAMYDVAEARGNKQGGGDQRVGRSEGRMLQIGQTRLHFQTRAREMSLISRLNINLPSTARFSFLFAC